MPATPSVVGHKFFRLLLIRILVVFAVATANDAQCPPLHRNDLQIEPNLVETMTDTVRDYVNSFSEMFSFKAL